MTEAVLRVLRRTTTLALFLALSPLAAGAQFPSDSALRGVLKDRVDSGRSAGIVLGLLDADGRTRIIAYNEHKHGEADFNARTIFEIGSITKTFTAAILADMVARGELKLEDPVARYLPGSVKVPTRAGKEITLLDLATQSSGLPRMPNNVQPTNGANPYADYTVQQMYDFLSSYQLTREIGAQYEYSNVGFGLLGQALALRAGKTYSELVRERVLQPLAMSSTSVELSPEQKGRLAPGHGPNGSVVSNWDIPGMAGAGALRSNMEDMLKYLRAQLQPSSSQAAQRMTLTHAPRRPAGSDAMKIGLGWHVMTRPDRMLTWHNGGTGGYRTFIGFDAKNKRGVVVLTNMSTSADDIGFHLLDTSIPYAAPPVSTAAAARKEISVEGAILQQYVGTYELAPDLAITVSRDGDKLFIHPTGQGQLRIWPESPTDFFLKEVDAQIRFARDAGGDFVLTLVQNGQSMVGRRSR